MKKTMHMLIALTVLLSVIFSLTGCGSRNAATGNTSSGALQTITIGVMPDIDSIPFIIAEQNGFFKEQGIDVKLQHFKSAQERDSALQGGKLDGEITDILALLFAKEGGFELRATSSSIGDYKLVVGKDSGITSPDGLKGKSVAISANTLIEYSTDKMLQQFDLKIDDIRKVAIPQIPVRLEMLQNGKVDAATLPDPLATVAVKNGASLLSSTGKLGINPGIIAFTQKAIDTKEDEIAAVYRAYNKAIDYLRKESPSSYMDLVIKEAGFPEIVKDALVLPEFKKADMPDEKDLISVMEWMAGKKLIKKQFKLDELVTDKFIK